MFFISECYFFWGGYAVEDDSLMVRGKNVITKKALRCYPQGIGFIKMVF